jgi:HEPN pEK499 p136
MGYPIGPLLQTLAQRVLSNLEFIEDNASSNPKENQVPYSDTQLLISLLGILIFPHERAPNALGRLLKGYEHLGKVVAVKYPNDPGKVELTDLGGETRLVDPSSIEDLPRLLRNSIAHFNIRPIDKDGRFGGIRVWNKNDDPHETTMVADIDFEALRPLAHHILKSLADPKADYKLTDPEDPLEAIEQQKPRQRKRKAPRINNTAWEPILHAHGGDHDRAKTYIDRLLREEANHLTKS